MSTPQPPSGRYDVVQDSQWVKQHIRSASDADRDVELDLINKNGFSPISFRAHTVLIEDRTWMYIGTTIDDRTINIHLSKDGSVNANLFE
jgi:hypothetical protein